MKDSSKGSRQIIQLDLVESLLKDNKFKEALAEIREKETQKGLNRFSYEWGWLSHLAANALQGLGRCEEALNRAKEALGIFKNTPENAKLAQIQFNLGIIYSDLGDLRNSELQFTDAASTYRRVEDKKGIIRTYNELSRICFTKARYDTAIEYLDDGIIYCEEIKDQKLAATMVGNLGTVYMITDRWERARKNLLKSLDLNTICKNESNVCRSYLSLGCLSILLREFSKGKEYLRRAYHIIQENSFAREAAIYHEYSGELAFVQGDWEKANQHYLEAIKLGEQIAPKSTIVSQAYRLLAELQTERGEFQKAFISCEKSLLASKDVGERLEEAMVYRTLGRLYSQNGHLAEVKENFAQAIRMLEEIGAKFELAKTYLDMAKCEDFGFWERMKFLGRAEDSACQLDCPYYLAQVYVGFAELFSQDGKFAEAQDFLNRAKCRLERLDEKKDLELLSALEKKMEAHHPTNQSIFVNSSTGFSFANIITQDKATLEMFENIWQIRDLDITILLEGETGTGKDLLAKIIHHTSNRKDSEFVVASCAAVPEGLFESELFGHKKGAFTGAVADKKGLLDEATGGTLYLDEIAEVPLSIQVKLLRAIEEKEIVPVGEVKPRKIDFRVIAATNRDLEELVNEGRFRNDLFYRLNVMRFKLPSLKQRHGDIPLLVKHFLEKHSAEVNGQNSLSGIPALDPKIMDFFETYHWPGNIRELDNVVKRLLISSRGQDKISFDLLNKDAFENGKSPQSDSLTRRIAEYEKEQIMEALIKANGVKTRAARLLNIDEARLRYKIKKYGITFP